LSLRVTPGNSWDHGAGGVDGGLLAKKIVGDFGVTDPDMHFTANCQAEETVVLITKLPHRVPWSHWVDIMDATNVGDGAPGAGNELQTWWRLVFQKISDELDCGDEEEDGTCNPPFVCANGIDSGLRFLEQSFGGRVVLKEMLDLGHDDRWRDRRRHVCCCKRGTAGR